MTPTTAFRFWMTRDPDIGQIVRTLSSPDQVERVLENLGEVLVLDTFDQALRRSGRLLFQAGRRLWLIDPARPAARAVIVRQSCRLCWRFIHELPAGQVKDRLSAVSPLRALLPIGTAALRREQLALRDEGGRVVVRVAVYLFDRPRQTTAIGVIQATCPSRAAQEASQSLITLFSRQGAQPFGVATTDGAATDAYALLGMADSGYQARPVIPLDPDAPISATIRRILSAFARVARANEAGLRADLDTEFLHDYRVSLRKVRAVLSFCAHLAERPATDRLKPALAEIMRATNRLRDLDVYLLTQDHVFAQLPAARHAGLHLMFAAFREERAACHAQVVQMLDSPAYAETMRALTAWADMPPPSATAPGAGELTLPFARRRIWKRYRQANALARRITESTPDHELHRLRIQCKKLRYALEIFAPLFVPVLLKPLLKALKRLQATLGALNDCAVQQRSLQAFTQEHAARHAEAAQLTDSSAALIAVLRHQQLAAHSQILTHLNEFTAAEIRAGFAALCSKTIRY
jgi:CHAD domain-containing protein